jgi:hypothetical protein
MPVYLNKEYANLKDWHSTRRITQPDLINTSYVEEKLNSGR